MSHFSRNAADAMSGRILSRFRQHLGVAALAFALAFAGAKAVPAHEFKVGDIRIEHPWSRATPAGAKVAGGYFTLANNGSAPDRLLSISSDVSEMVELHEMSVKDGVMTMRPVAGGLEIPAGGKVALAPGGYHLMFIGLKRQPRQGEKFAATLTFEKAGAVSVEFAVEGMSEMGSQMSGQMDGMNDHAD
jgi:copper(I)-binding protein